ncbi:MAG: hypothetical protein ACJ768_12745 [Gaiellaceae bacterium]
MNDEQPAETVRPLELLHRCANYLGTVVLLSSSADRFQAAGDRTRRKLYTLDPGSRLTRLLVVRLARDEGPRWWRLHHGVTLAQVPLEDGVPLDAVAQLLVGELHALIAEAGGWDRRNAA